MGILKDMKYELTSKEWWKAATLRAARTAFATAIPFFVAVSILEVDWVLIVSTVGLSVIATYLTSLAGLKEITGDHVNKFFASVTRAVRTFAQVFVSYIGAAAVIQEVDWVGGLALAASATVVSFLNGLISNLPESDTPEVFVVVDTKDESLTKG